MMQEYKRSTALDFLDDCPKNILSFYKYWDSKRRGRTMPSRADLDPIEMKPFLSSLILVDVTHEPLNFTYRLVGTKEVSARGCDPTGHQVYEHAFGTTTEEVMTNYKIVSEKKCPVFDQEGVSSEVSSLRQGDALLLPLSDDGQTVNMVVAFTDYINF
ncbi:PAS domain-containing protein [Kiloniella antarctica]|uniref:PAS domain-containing protein n=1 Tax=Kiloniella antarctica TaxID=1550907 RepID=A0ABW5BKQ8_9PROT